MHKNLAKYWNTLANFVDVESTKIIYIHAWCIHLILLPQCMVGQVGTESPDRVYLKKWFLLYVSLSYMIIYSLMANETYAKKKNYPAIRMSTLKSAMCVVHFLVCGNSSNAAIGLSRLTYLFGAWMLTCRICVLSRMNDNYNDVRATNAGILIEPQFPSCIITKVKSVHFSKQSPCVIMSLSVNPLSPWMGFFVGLMCLFLSLLCTGKPWYLHKYVGHHKYTLL